ncbi:MAG: ATP-dependent DNA helicase [Nitrosomonadales bacterium]
MSEVKFFDSYYSSTGPLNGLIKNYNPRIGQMEMSTFLDDIFRSNKSAIIEAGTGIGKTLGYLIPALRLNKKIIISTATKNLQNQLFKKDLDIAQKSLGINFTVQSLKGRANYICLHRFNQNQLFDRLNDQKNYHSVSRFLTQTRSGLLEEVPDYNASIEMTLSITSTSDNCLHSKCDFSNDCFVNKARRKSNKAEVIIINHHLFFSDFYRKDENNNILPDADIIIFDEAHNLIDIAQQYVTKRFSSAALMNLVNELIQQLRKNLIQIDPLTQSFNNLNMDLSSLSLMFKNLGKISLYKFKKRKEFYENINRIQNSLSQILKKISNFNLNDDLEKMVEQFENFIETLNYIFEYRDSFEFISWVDSYRQSFSINLSPIKVEDVFKKIQSENTHKSFLFLSATLAVENNFDLFKKFIGIENIETKKINSPFDYEQNAILNIPQNLPIPSEHDFYPRLVEYIYPLIQANYGKTLILTTSLRGLALVKDELQKKINQHREDLNLFVQGDQSSEQLIDKYLQTRNAILIGSLSFWEGLDFKGDQLRLLIIDKLPFETPDDPLIDARINLLKEKDFFSTYQLPRMLINLNQGLGRLIRDFDDKGAVILCDKRVSQKPYGKKILRSISPFKISDNYNDILEYIS